MHRQGKTEAHISDSVATCRSHFAARTQMRQLQSLHIFSLISSQHVLIIFGLWKGTTYSLFYVLQDIDSDIQGFMIYIQTKCAVQIY